VEKLDELLDDISKSSTGKYSGESVAASRPPAGSGGGGDEGGLFSFFSSVAGKVTDSAAGMGTLTGSVQKGLYIHGGVGCGKTYLMNLFQTAAEAVTGPGSVQKVHFHAFMLGVHKAMHLAKLQGESDPLPFVIDEIARKGKIICFDEFQVTDVADAMILKRLFTGLYALDCVFVSTSNRPPLDLYKGGLQRDLFVPFIDLLCERNVVVSMDESPTDYRLVHGALQVRNETHGSFRGSRKTGRKKKGPKRKGCLLREKKFFSGCCALFFLPLPRSFRCSKCALVVRFLFSFPPLPLLCA